jgi:hypothetical protein
MKDDSTVQQLIEQWLDLKRRAESETDAEKAMLVVIEIDEFFLLLEARSVTNDKVRLSGGANHLATAPLDGGESGANE